MRAVIAIVLLLVTPCYGVTCDQAWNYQYCAYPPLRVASFSGATAGDKIAACIAALPATGGVCDARDLPNGGTIPAMTLGQSGATLLGPCGYFFVTGTIQIFNPTGISGFTWKGCGAANAKLVGTFLIWNGNAIDPMFRIRGTRDSVFEDLTVASTEAQPMAEGIRLETQTGVGSTSRVFRNIRMSGNNVGGLIKGFRWCTGDDCGGAGADGNNDIDLLENVIVTNYTNCAFSIEHGQSKAHNFKNSSFVGNSFGQRGVCTTQSPNSAHNSGSFRWYGGGGGGNTVADFDIGAPDDNILISGCDLESSARFLQTGGPSSSHYVVTIEGCRWGALNLNPDDNIILFQYKGPLNLIGNFFEGAKPGSSPKIALTTTAPVLGNAIGNSIAWDVATAQSNPFVGGTWSKMGNLIRDNANNSFPIQ